MLERHDLSTLNAAERRRELNVDSPAQTPGREPSPLENPPAIAFLPDILRHGTLDTRFASVLISGGSPKEARTSWDFVADSTPKLPSTSCSLLSQSQGGKVFRADP